MKILGIESSCDETAATVIENGTKILSNVVASSLEMHAKTGGIIPEVAAREQVKCIIPVIQEALKKGCGWVMSCESPKTHNSPPPIDAIAVTVGPGLIGSLLVGIETAKTLAYLWNKPIVPVNHMVGHLYANWLDTSKPVKQLNSKTVVGKTVKNNTDGTGYCSTSSPIHCFTEPNFPAIALVVSGGHTDLVLMKDHGKIEYLGGTRDDAAGECFDKSARLLGLGYPGGPAISAAAEKFEIRNSKFEIKLPRPMINDDSFDFSFSGLKTAVLNLLRANGWVMSFESSYESGGRAKLNTNPHNPSSTHNSQLIPTPAIAYELQEAITDVLVSKTIKAVEKYHVKSILLAGGVSANARLREKFIVHSAKYKVHVPPSKLCTDNAAYIASCAFFNYKPVPWQKINVNPGLTISDKV